MGNNKIVFIISLPRSGSTMLQHILGAHSEMVATAEPWILFPASMSLKEDTITAPYNHEICRIALNDFLGQLKNKEQEYYNAVRKMATHLYDTFLKEKEKNIFIDKTSRYYLILPELMRIFPDAKFIFIVRNPLAIFSSFITSMVGNNIEGLGDVNIRNDLLFGYKLLYEGYKTNKKNSIIVRYEDIIKNPEIEIESICKYIGVKFEKTMLDYKAKIGILQGKLVDTKSIHKHDRPVNKYIDAWKNNLKTKQNKILVKGFIENIGKDLVKKTGYSFNEFNEFVKDINIKDQKSLKYVQWNDLLTHPNNRTILIQNKLYITKMINNKQYKSLIFFFIKHPRSFLRICKFIIKK